VTDTAEAVADRGAARRRRWPWVVGAVVAVLVAAGVPTAVWFAHWRSSLHVFATYPMYGATETLQVGHTNYFGNNLVAAHAIDHPSDFSALSLQVSAIRPVVLENTADAKIAVLRCVARRSASALLGENEATAQDKCSTLTPFTSGSLTLGVERNQDDIVIAITPRHAGTVRIAGVDVHYSKGLRHGVQHTGAQIKTTTK
jgi:hypothetical protein